MSFAFSFVNRNGSKIYIIIYNGKTQWMIFYMGDVDFDLLQKVTVSFCKSNRTWKVIKLASRQKWTKTWKRDSKRDCRSISAVWLLDYTTFEGSKPKRLLLVSYLIKLHRPTSGSFQTCGLWWRAYIFVITQEPEMEQNCRSLKAFAKRLRFKSEVKITKGRRV